MSDVVDPDKVDSLGTSGLGASVPDSSSTPAEPVVAPDEGAGYRLAEPEPTAGVPDPSEAVSPAAEPAESTFQPSSNETPESADVFPKVPPEVHEVWSRWLEWTYPALWTGAGVTFATLIVFAGSTVATLTFLAAVTYGAYCVVTSLEVPVRVTPEQAVKEFFAAASHRLPNFRRMYALLTTDAQRSSEFSGFAQFRSYWMAIIARHSRLPAWLVPLEFQVEGFRSRYNPDKTLAAVSFRLKIAPRSRPDSVAPATVLEVKNLAVKGPDGQWYLNDGTLPDPTQERSH